MRSSNTRFSVALTASAALLVSVGTLAANATVPSYGRAGGAVGADRIEQLTAPNAIHATQTPDISKWYGRAGGAVGADRIDELLAEKSTGAKTYAATASKQQIVYGRAGVPLPFTD